MVGSVYSCKAPVIVQNDTYITKQERPISYTIISPKKTKGKALVVILNTAADTINLLESPLVKYLKHQQYTILLPSHAGSDNLEKVSFNTLSNRKQDIKELIQHTDSVADDALVLIGFGEGAYLCPALANETQAQKCFVINAGPYSILDEYSSFLNQSEPEPNMLNLLLKANNLTEVQELKDKVQAIIDGDVGFDKLAGGSDYYFREYQANPMMLELMKARKPVYWIFSEDYPLVSNKNRTFSKELAGGLPNVYLIDIEGKGNFNNPEEMKELTTVISSLISSD